MKRAAWIAVVASMLLSGWNSNEVLSGWNPNIGADIDTAHSITVTTEDKIAKIIVDESWGWKQTWNAWWEHKWLPSNSSIGSEEEAMFAYWEENDESFTVSYAEGVEITEKVLFDKWFFRGDDWCYYFKDAKNKDERPRDSNYVISYLQTNWKNIWEISWGSMNINSNQKQKLEAYNRKTDNNWKTFYITSE